MDILYNESSVNWKSLIFWKQNFSKTYSTEDLFMHMHTEIQYGSDKQSGSKVLW